MQLRRSAKNNDERKLLFYRKISSSHNVILKTLMCLSGASSDYMFLCNKYGVRPTSTRDSIKCAVTDAFLCTAGCISLAFSFSAVIVYDFLRVLDVFCMFVFTVLP